jgi:outer membrane protein assembly factor BamB
MMHRLILALSMLASVFAAPIANGEDAPQFRGPDRDGHFADTGLLKSWPEGGPTLAWEVDTIGMGYSSVSTVDGILYVTGMLGEDDGYLFALDTEGKELWRLKYGKETTDKQAPGARSTLTVEGTRGYLISGFGVVSCINLVEREFVWQVDTFERFGGKQIQWSIAESPLVDGERLYCMPGGPNAAMAALDKHTGETIWTTRDYSDASAYCSPNLIVHNGRRILVSMTAKGLIGVDAEDGTLLWTRDHPDRWDIHANTPVYSNGMLYYVAGSKVGGVMVRISEDGSDIAAIWTDTEMDVLHGGVVLKDGYIYGTAHNSGREMMCLSLETGEIQWRSSDISEGVTVYADGMLYIYEGPKKGIVSLVKATPDGFERRGQFKIEKGTAKHWAHPTIADGRLYIRRGEYLFAYDIQAN